MGENPKTHNIREWKHSTIQLHIAFHIIMWLLVSLCKEDIRSYIDSYNRSHLITTSIMSKKYHTSAVFATGHAGHNNR
jgi:hypothetical protein